MFNQKTIYLPGGLSYEERCKLAEEILFTLGDYTTDYWESPKVKKILDVLADYISRSKEFRQNNSHPTLGANRKEKLYKGDKRMINFSDLLREIKDQLGIDDVVDEPYEA